MHDAAQVVVPEGGIEDDVEMQVADVVCVVKSIQAEQPQLLDTQVTATLAAPSRGAEQAALAALFSGSRRREELDWLRTRAARLKVADAASGSGSGSRSLPLLRWR